MEHWYIICTVMIHMYMYTVCVCIHVVHVHVYYYYYDTCTPGGKKLLKKNTT